MIRLSALILVFFASTLAALGQESGGPIRCLTDELHLELTRNFPEGVPGRTEARDLSTLKTDFDWTYVIPIVVHVMHDNGPELNVDMAQVQSQIEVLNEDYGRYGAGANTNPVGADIRIRFCLATIDPDGQPFTGINYVQYPPTFNIDPFNEDTLLKRVIHWDPDRYLNVYVVRQISDGRIGGYAYFPNEAAGTIYDGFVVDHRFFGRDAGTAISEGRTATHEVGHYLGLFHPWGIQENNCDTDDDGCEDTPGVGREYFSSYPVCPHPPSCGTELRMIENYMDYSDDRCMNVFTQCQADKMRNAILEYRYELVSSANLARTACGSTLQGVVPSDQVFQVFPNPTQNILMVYADFDDEILSEVEIVDFTGRRMYFNPSAGFGRGPIPVDLSKYNEGVYYLIVRRGDQQLRKTILVAR